MISRRLSKIIDMVSDGRRSIADIGCDHAIVSIELAKKYPDEVQIVHTNKDKSIVCHFPADYLRINRPRELSEEEKKRRTELLKKNINK